MAIEKNGMDEIDVFGGFVCSGSQILPQGMAALVEAEAGKMPPIHEVVPILSKDGKPLLDKHGKPRTRNIRKPNPEWRPDVINSIGAAGLTQFLPIAWREVAGYPNSLLRSRCAELASQQGVSHLTDAQILRLRLDPELSVVSAGEYAFHNINAFGDAGFSVSAITGVNRAKLGYFLHHEGLQGATKLLNGDVTSHHAYARLATQLGGTDEADAYQQKVGLTGLAAYRKWLFDYIDTKINPRYFACDPGKLEEPLTMEQIAKKLK